MTGCRHNAKNTLVKNYLHLAERAGAAVHPLTTVTDVRPLPDGGYEVTARWTKAKASRRTAVKTFHADQVVFSAAAIGTQRLLHRLKARGVPAGGLRPAGRADPDELRGDPLRHGLRRLRRLVRGRGHHLLLPPRRAHPHRAGPVRPRSQRHAVAGHRPGRRGRGRASLEDLGQGAVEAATRPQGALLAEHVVAANRRRPGHADPGQLDHDRVASAWPDRLHVVGAGSRRPQPDLHPGRLRRSAPAGPDHEGQGGLRRRRRAARACR